MPTSTARIEAERNQRTGRGFCVPSGAAKRGGSGSKPGPRGSSLSVSVPLCEVLEFWFWCVCLTACEGGGRSSYIKRSRARAGEEPPEGRGSEEKKLVDLTKMPPVRFLGTASQRGIFVVEWYKTYHCVFMIRREENCARTTRDVILGSTEYL